MSQNKHIALIFQVINLQDLALSSISTRVAGFRRASPSTALDKNI
jgi:hypothetical protein